MKPVRSKRRIAQVKSGIGLSGLVNQSNQADGAPSSESFLTSRAARVMLAGAGFLADAYDLFVINLVLRLLKDEYPEYTLSGRVHVFEGSVASAALVGSILGQVVAGSLADIVGRQKIFVATAALITIGSIGSACSVDTPLLTIYGQICCWRFFLGAGVGGEYPLAATVTSESSSAGNRGALMAAVFAMQGVGSLLSGVIVFLCLKLGYSTAFTWRFALAFGAVPALLAFPWRLRMHETESFERVKRDRQIATSVTRANSTFPTNKNATSNQHYYYQATSTNSTLTTTSNPPKSKTPLVGANTQHPLQGGDVGTVGFIETNDGKHFYYQQLPPDILDEENPPHSHDQQLGVGTEDDDQDEEGKITIELSPLQPKLPPTVTKNNTNDQRPLIFERQETLQEKDLSSTSQSNRRNSGDYSFHYDISSQQDTPTKHDEVDEEEQLWTTAVIKQPFHKTTSRRLLQPHSHHPVTSSEDEDHMLLLAGGVVQQQQVPVVVTGPVHTRYAELRQAVKLYGWHMFGTAFCWFLLDVDFYANGLFNHEVTSRVFGSGSSSNEKTTAVDDAWNAIILSLIAIPGYLLAVTYIDKLGRKNLQLLGFIVTGALFLICGLGYDRILGMGDPLGGYVFLVVYSFTFLFSNFGANTTTFVIPGEIYPAAVRATCHGLSAASGKLGAATGAFIFPLILTSTTGGTVTSIEGIKKCMIICGLVAWLGAIITVFFIPKYGRNELIASEESARGYYIALEHSCLQPKHEDILQLYGPAAAAAAVVKNKNEKTIIPIFSSYNNSRTMLENAEEEEERQQQLRESARVNNNNSRREGNGGRSNNSKGFVEVIHAAHDYGLNDHHSTNIGEDKL